MAEVTIEGTALVVTPIQSSQGRPMVQITLGDPFKGPVTFPLEMDKEVAGITVALQRTLTQLPGFGQQLGTPRMIVTITEEEYQELGRPRYPDHLTVTLRVQPEAGPR
jgi:hypothetical protein